MFSHETVPVAVLVDVGRPVVKQAAGPVSVWRDYALQKARNTEGKMAACYRLVPGGTASRSMTSKGLTEIDASREWVVPRTSYTSIAQRNQMLDVVADR
jgi:hypothetical protein